jgi:hypothetical protein
MKKILYILLAMLALYLMGCNHGYYCRPSPRSRDYALHKRSLKAPMLKAVSPSYTKKSY